MESTCYHCSSDKDLHTADYTQLYDFLKYNQKEKEEARIQLQAEEFDFMAAVADLDEIKEVNANCILMANLQQASTSYTQTDKVSVYDSDGSAEVHDYENYDDNEIFNMFTQEEQYTELLEPIPEPHQVPHNDNNDISEVTSVEQSGETVKQHLANFKETQLLDLNKQLSKKKSTVSFLLEKKKKLTSDFKTREDELLDKQIQLEKKIKELSNILVKTEFLDDTTPSVARKFLNEVKTTTVTLQRVVKHRMTLETHNWSSSAHQELHKIVKDKNFPIVNQVDAIEQNFEIQFLKEAAKFVGDFKSLAKEADESLAKHKTLELEIKCLLRAVKKCLFVRNLEGVDFLKGDHSTNLYTINLHEMASASPICLIARASSTKSWLWHQQLSHLNFDTINDLARNNLVSGLPKFKYNKAHLCNSCEQGKSKKASHPSKPVPNSRQRLHLLHMDLCGPMRITSINAKWYVLVIVDDYSRYTWNRSIIHHRFNKTPYELINGRKLDISFLYIFGALCYPKNDREDIGKLDAKGDIGLDLTYAPSTITTQQLTKGELDLFFEAMYDDYIGGQPSATARTDPPAQEPQVRQTSTASTTIADTAPTPTNSSFHATNIPITLQDVDGLNPNALFDGNTFVNPFGSPSTSVTESSSSHNVDPSNMHIFYQPYPYEFQ
uniref:Retrovirus-related Pol polyprotein from transposon TNT 1-94 n=1 Tax=Tanacetum cinerariifolium TaxID=118510 RepID=A0A6L2JJB0_TANCI|nr:retrovirus-related Pol polyprotein from transposon TNT 1-94 [Tanacetum cinerariifolium]